MRASADKQVYSTVLSTGILVPISTSPLIVFHCGCIFKWNYSVDCSICNLLCHLIRVSTLADIDFDVFGTRDSKSCYLIVCWFFYLGHVTHTSIHAAVKTRHIRGHANNLPDLGTNKVIIRNLKISNTFEILNQENQTYVNIFAIFVIVVYFNSGIKYMNFILLAADLCNRMSE
nr:PREDICTED: uncharacterized protein LOC105663989 [Megachile rotundata]